MRVLNTVAFQLAITALLLSISVFFSKPAKAAIPPALIEPANNSQTSDTSPKLTWQYSGSCSSNESCFKVEVDDASDFSSLNKNSYTNNTYYSPQLTQGKWYWRVKAKDSSNIWSEFSESFSFEIVSQVQTPQPLTTPSTLLPQSPAPTTSSAKKTQTFVITSVPNSFSSRDEISTRIELNDFPSNTVYFLKGAFFKNGSTNYFGKTKVFGNWVKNSENSAKQFQVTTDSSGNWSGDAKIMADPDDSGFSGSGKYFLKVGRYSSAGSGPSWSNEVAVDISHTEISPKSNEKSLTSDESEITSETKQSSAKEDTALKLAEKSYSIPANLKASTVSGAATESSKPVEEQIIVKSETKFNSWLIAGGIIFFLIALVSVVIIFKKR